MKKLLTITFLFVSAFAYSQTGAQGANGAPTGAYQPNTNPESSLDPADRSPQKVLEGDKKLVARLQKLLPEQVTPQQACDGFKKLGDCVSTLHVAQNLRIPLIELKNKVIADKSHDAIEKAIHELRPDVDAKAEKKKAQKQAERDMPVSD